jgi:phenylpropionate dioxygenase-like ring-hydroxylating dioxygenase large terminal subunit
VADRFSFSPFPNSWIQVAWSHELKRGDLKTVRGLGRELVVFRGRDGVARALDAHCPHLGAHLGVGGEVVDNHVRCPFHGWCFDGTGACVHIPYSSQIPNKARVGSYPVCEKNGIVFIWHDAQGRAPWFEIPSVPEAGSREWTRPHHYAFSIRTRWREIVENAVDRAHFFQLHGYPQMPELDFRVDGPRFFMQSRVPWQRFGRRLDVRLDIESHGAGFAITRGVGDLPFLVMGCPLPIDEETVIHHMTFFVSKKIPFPLRELAVRFVRYTAVREFKRDIPIWENKLSLDHPVLCEGDGPIFRFRAWARQFSDDAVPLREAK